MICYELGLANSEALALTHELMCETRHDMHEIMTCSLFDSNSKTSTKTQLHELFDAKFRNTKLRSRFK